MRLQTENTLLELAGAELERMKSRIEDLETELAQAECRAHNDVRDAALEEAALAVAALAYTTVRIPTDGSEVVNRDQALEAIRALKSPATKEEPACTDLGTFRIDPDSINAAMDAGAAFRRQLEPMVRSLHADPPGSRMQRPPTLASQRIADLMEDGVASAAVMNPRHHSKNGEVCFHPSVIRKTRTERDKALAEVERLRGVLRETLADLERTKYGPGEGLGYTYLQQAMSRLRLVAEGGGNKST